MLDDYQIITVNKSNTSLNRQIDELLTRSKIRRDENLEYTCAMVDDDFNVIATGSYFSTTLRCLAVNCHFKGQGLLNKIVTHLVNKLFDIGRTHLFIFTKAENEIMFKDLSFHTIAKVKNDYVFMENKKTGFEEYLSELKEQSPLLGEDKVQSAIVMNANPFTLGHLYLVEQASKSSDLVHLFVLSEDVSIFPYDIRWKLIEDGVRHLNNVVIHPTNSYLISSATFPSYFQKDSIEVIKSQAALDLLLFKKIATTLNITHRFVGEEPYSVVTNEYNKVMLELLNNEVFQLTIVPRLIKADTTVSASTVRQAIHDEDWSLVQSLVPDSTYHFLTSTFGESVVSTIQQSNDLLHY